MYNEKDVSILVLFLFQTYKHVNTPVTNVEIPAKCANRIVDATVVAYFIWYEGFWFNEYVRVFE